MNTEGWNNEKPEKSIEAEIEFMADGQLFRGVGFYDHRDDSWHQAQSTIPKPKQWRFMNMIE